jgi:hypothetical protein
MQTQTQDIKGALGPLRSAGLRLALTAFRVDEQARAAVVQGQFAAAAARRCWRNYRDYQAATGAACGLPEEPFDPERLARDPDWVGLLAAELALMEGLVGSKMDMMGAVTRVSCRVTEQGSRSEDWRRRAVSAAERAFAAAHLPTPPGPQTPLAAAEGG